MGHSMPAVLSHLPVDGQIHAYNPKGPAERDLTCQARAEGLSACSHEIPKTVPGKPGLGVED